MNELTQTPNKKVQSAIQFGKDVSNSITSTTQKDFEKALIDLVSFAADHGMKVGYEKGYDDGWEEAKELYQYNS